MSTTTNNFGRVDEENNVFVVESDLERRVGQYPGVTPEEALAYFQRKFADLEAQVRLLEQRVASKADAQSLKKAIAKLTEDLKEPAAVGDIAALRSRVVAVEGKVESLFAEKIEQNKELIAAEITKRAAIDASNKASKAAKAQIVADAEALVSKGGEAITEYRKLLDAWKASARAKTDDELWARFKAAGDAIYAAKSEFVAIESTEQAANLAVKLELLTEAEKIDVEKDLVGAKKQLQSVQTRWEKAGRVPREKLREVEDRLKAIESKVRKAEEDQWRKTDPAAIARTNSVLEQLDAAIAKLDKQLVAAKATKDAKKIKDAEEALEARKQWREVVVKTL